MRFANISFFKDNRSQTSRKCIPVLLVRRGSIFFCFYQRNVFFCSCSIHFFYIFCPLQLALIVSILLQEFTFLINRVFVSVSISPLLLSMKCLLLFLFHLLLLLRCLSSGKCLEKYH